MKPAAHSGHLARESAPAPAPGWLARCVVALLVPAAFRDEFLGDLTEELRTSRRLSDHGPAAARRWMWRQIVASAPSLIRCRLTRGGKMAKYRWIAALTFALVGSLQAWDSRVLDAPGHIVALVACGLAVQFFGFLLASSAGARLATFLTFVALIFSAKILSPIALPALGVLGVIGLALNFGYSALERRQAQVAPPSGPTAA
jgi:hypothetical protein